MQNDYDKTQNWFKVLWNHYKGKQNDYNSNAENECEEIQNNDKGMQNIYNKTQIKTSV